MRVQDYARLHNYNVVTPCQLADPTLTDMWNNWVAPESHAGGSSEHVCLARGVGSLPEGELAIQLGSDKGLSGRSGGGRGWGTGWQGCMKCQDGDDL